MRCLWIDEEEEGGGYEGGEEEFMKFLCNLIGEFLKRFCRVGSFVINGFFLCDIYIGIGYKRGYKRKRRIFF